VKGIKDPLRWQPPGPTAISYSCSASINLGAGEIRWTVSGYSIWYHWNSMSRDCETTVPIQSALRTSIWL